MTKETTTVYYDTEDYKAISLLPLIRDIAGVESASILGEEEEGALEIVTNNGRDNMIAIILTYGLSLYPLTLS